MFCVLERRTRKVQGGGGDRQLAAVAAPDVKHNLWQTPAQGDHGDGGRLEHCDRRREQNGFSPSALCTSKLSAILMAVDGGTVCTYWKTCRRDDVDS